MTVTTARNGALGAAVAGALLVLAACGSDDPASGVASAGGQTDAAGDAGAAETGDTESLDPDDQALVFAECMRDNDVDMPDPGPGQEGLSEAFREVAEGSDQETLEQAFTACRDQLPQYASQQHDDEDMLDLAECLREQGLDVSDNPFDDAHSGRIDQSEFSAAMEECRDVLAGGGS